MPCFFFKRAETPLVDTKMVTYLPWQVWCCGQSVWFHRARSSQKFWKTGEVHRFRGLGLGPRTRQASPPAKHKNIKKIQPKKKFTPKAEFFSDGSLTKNHLHFFKSIRKKSSSKSKSTPPPAPCFFHLQKLVDDYFRWKMFITHLSKVMLATAAISLIIVCSLTFGGARKPSCNVDVTDDDIRFDLGFFLSIPVNMAVAGKKRLGLGLSDLRFLRSPRNWWDLAGFILYVVLYKQHHTTHMCSTFPTTSLKLWRNRLAGI